MTGRFRDLAEPVNRDPERRARVERHKAEMDTEELAYTLGELRRVLETTQATLAGRLSITQPTLSGIENGNDPMLSTLRNVVEGLGGRLEVTAVFENSRFRLAPGEAPQAH